MVRLPSPDVGALLIVQIPVEAAPPILDPANVTAVPEQAVKAPPASTVGKACTVTIRVSVTTVHGPVGSSVVKVKV